MVIQTIPDHENSVYIMYEDIWHGDIYCPFCGTISVNLLSGQLEEMMCPHILFAESPSEIVYLADIFLKELQKLVPSLTRERAFDVGSVPWPSDEGDGFVSTSTSSFCGIFPNSITIATCDSQTGDETTISFAPVNVAKLERLNVTPGRNH